MIYDQWPVYSFKPIPFTKVTPDQIKKRCYLIQKIESFFENIFNTPVVLTPSGRSALSQILRLHNANRSNVIFAPLWSSHCLWDVVSRYSNPTCFYTANAAISIVVHKWGEIYYAPKNNQSLIIEDSIDSIYMDSSSFFPNQGEYEIISLPKILGNYCGAIILLKNKKFLETFKKLQNENESLGKSQSYLKYSTAINQKKLHHNWEAYEHLNTFIDYNGLMNIQANLNKLIENRNIILKRMEYLSTKKNNYCNQFIHKYFLEKRCPPVFPINIENIDQDAVLASLLENHKILVRNKSINFDISCPEFKPHILLPLHCGVSDDVFFTTLDLINCR